MSNVLGIIAEYNPFHNGHLYHLNESKKITNSDYTVAVISGNFTQRGSTSIIDKWSKTEMALDNGVDLVIELPLLYSISSAENFSEGAIKILNELGIVDYLSFGSETDNIDKLSEIASILNDEPSEYKNLLEEELKQGLPFPKARENAIINYLHDDNLSNILSEPNNILGIEYLKALKKYNSNIKPICIKRFNSNYNSTDISSNIASSTGIRELLKKDNKELINNLVPQSSYNNLISNIDNNKIVLDLNVFEKEILYTLRKMNIESISNLPDVSEGLEYSIKEAVNSTNSLNELLEKIKSKRYTLTRLQRILLYALLGITKTDMEISKSITPYIRVLGFNENGKELLAKINKNNQNLNIITSLKKFIDNTENNDLNTLIEKDILATNIYTLGYKNSTLSKSNLDFTNNIIKK